MATAEARSVVDLPKVSADAHVNEPHDLWYRRLPEDMREAAPHRIQSEEDGGWRLVVNGEVDESAGGVPATDPEAAAAEMREEDSRREADVSMDVRHAMMRTDGINGEMIYPTIGLYAYSIENPAVGEASCRVYNDWIHEKLGDESPRIRYAGLIPTWDVGNAIAEIQRVASWPSVAGIMLPLVGTPDWNMPQWEPMWDAIDETGLPVIMHQGTGHRMIFYRGWGSPTANLLATQTMGPRAAALLACSGLLERHPDLEFVLVEVNGGWLGWTMSTLDEYFLAHQAARRKPYLPELPSHYLRRQVRVTFQRDLTAIIGRGYTGVECLLWGNDFPHIEGTYPNSNQVLAELFDGVSQDDAAQIVGLNAVRLFGFEPSILESAPS